MQVFNVINNFLSKLAFLRWSLCLHAYFWKCYSMWDLFNVLSKVLKYTLSWNYILPECFNFANIETYISVFKSKKITWMNHLYVHCKCMKWSFQINICIPWYTDFTQFWISQQWCQLTFFVQKKKIYCTCWPMASWQDSIVVASAALISVSSPSHFAPLNRLHRYFCYSPKIVSSLGVSFSYTNLSCMHRMRFSWND